MGYAWNQHFIYFCKVLYRPVCFILLALCKPTEDKLIEGKWTFSMAKIIVFTRPY